MAPPSTTESGAIFNWLSRLIPKVDQLFRVARRFFCILGIDLDAKMALELEKNDLAARIRAAYSTSLVTIP